MDYTDHVAKVLDDADVTSAPASSDPALTASAVADDKFTVTGTLAPDQTVTVTYTAEVNADGDRGDNALGNFLTASNQVPPTECAEGSTTCTENPVTDPPVTEIAATKSVDPASGTEVKAGQSLTYTLTFQNRGTASGPVDYTDHLDKVLDDAAVTAKPVPSAAALTASEITDGAFTVTGSLAAGTTVSVTYTVKVKADGSRGDNNLANFLVPPGGTPGTACATGDPLCTENPVTPPPVTTPPAPPADLANTGTGAPNNSRGLAYTGANVTGFALLAGGALLVYRRRAKA